MHLVIFILITFFFCFNAVFILNLFSSFLQVTKTDLEQRHPQLEDIFTLAQNIKNKTSNLDVRTSITEKRAFQDGGLKKTRAVPKIDGI